MVGDVLDFTAGEQFCADNNLQLARWDTEDKYKDVGYMSKSGI